MKNIDFCFSRRFPALKRQLELLCSAAAVAWTGVYGVRDGMAKMSCIVWNEMMVELRLRLHCKEKGGVSGDEKYRRYMGEIDERRKEMSFFAFASPSSRNFNPHSIYVVQPHACFLAIDLL
jgi:hypothetical protein